MARPLADRFADAPVASLALVALAAILVVGTATPMAPTAAAVDATEQRPGIAIERPAVDGSGPNGVDDPCPANRSAAGASSPRIVEAYPNPTTDGNAGEYLVIDDPADEPTENLTLTDGYATAAVPADRPPGRVATSIDPNATAELTDDPVVELDGHLRLAADGDEIALANGSETLDAIAYRRAPEGEIWYRGDGAAAGRIDAESGAVARGDWWPRHATCLAPSTRTVDESTAFLLPDSPDEPLDAIAAADERIRLAGYTFTDADVAAELEAALDRGVAVDVLVEAGPVGGLPAETEPLLTRLEEAGATVRAIGGEGGRYGFHHPKYAVVDDAALVTSENWKPAGVGGASSRGWGAVVEDAALADDLAAVFDADFRGHDTAPWGEFRARAALVDEDVATGDFRERHGAASVDVDRAELLLAPDNAEDRLLELIDGAEESLRIVQVRIDGPEFVLLEAAVEAARDGVEVRILLDDSWYVAAENRELADRLEATADREGLGLDVRLAGGGSRFEKVHAKGLVIDEETAVVGSINWNEVSLRENREVAVVLHGDEAGRYYADAFDDDWEGDDDWPLPLGLVLAVAAGLAVVALLARRYVRFDSSTARADRPPQVPVTIQPAGSDRPGAVRPNASSGPDGERQPQTDRGLVDARRSAGESTDHRPNDDETGGRT